jgi:murein DD-endopeptidase MepM/ murein hydrolase activator NlpD
MNKLLEKIRSLFPLRQSRSSVVSPNESAVNPGSAPQAARKLDRFTLISWTVTFAIVAALLGSTYLYKKGSVSSSPPATQPTTESGTNPPQGGGQLVMAENGTASFISRHLQLKTNIPERPRYKPVIYRVSRGDAMLAIAEKFKVKSESILYVNDSLEDNPHNLKPGMELTIPPVDGLYYEWKAGDTFETVASQFDAKVDDIINFPGNDIDLTDPQMEAGKQVMIPGGSRELEDWTKFLPTSGRSNDGSTGTSDFGSNACGGGPVASGFGWPANSTAITGNVYGPGHLGIDIQANEGDPVYAAGSGVITMAQGGWNYGYGNVVQIDHGNGYVTVYAHLSQINVSLCTPVGQGTLIGAAGNTGNSFGSHLHFEVRLGGSNINPLQIMQ